jgi:L-alanine-DL-glutamate epimerase-like enolase superfamily enzyme
VKLGYEIIELILEVPFAIARSTTRTHRVGLVRLEHEGLTGYGEASPSAYYGDSMEAVEEVVRAAPRLTGDDPLAFRAVYRRLAEAFPGCPSGRAAVDMAMYDLAGKVLGQPVHRILGLSGMNTPRSSLTVGVEDVETARKRLDTLRRFPLLKIKVGFGRERELLDLLKRETGARLRVDANEGWTSERAVSLMEEYRRDFDIDFFEQPLPRQDRDGYRRLNGLPGMLVVVDESVREARDVPAWRGLAGGVNIKLMKCGGLTPALDMIAAARATGLEVMLGCMVETSVAISGAAQLSPLVDYCDLDGNLLISNDPFLGVKAEGGEIVLPDKPGLGAEPA